MIGFDLTFVDGTRMGILLEIKSLIEGDSTGRLPRKVFIRLRGAKQRALYVRDYLRIQLGKRVEHLQKPERIVRRSETTKWAHNGPI